MKALLTDAWGNIRSQARATLVGVGGLTVALAACLLVALLALALATPDPHVRDPDRVVMLDFKGNPPDEPSVWFAASPVSFGPLLKARHAPLDLISRAAVGGMEFRMDGRTNPAYLLAVDPDLVDVLSLTALAGDLRATLERNNAVAISVELMHKLWGDVAPAQVIGRRLESHGLWYDVGAVIPDPDPRSPVWDASPLVGHAMAMTNFDSPANEMSEDDKSAIFLMTGQVFARLRPGTSADQVGGWVNDAFVSSPRYPELPAAWRNRAEPPAYFRALTLKQLPFSGPRNVLRGQLLSALGAACALLLVLASLNVMNLQAAGLLRRQRETALRRSLGASDAHLLALWTTEASLPLLLGTGAALLVTWWSAPAVANWLRLPPELPVADPVPLAAFAGLLATIAVLLPVTLGVPAWNALRRAPAAALQGRTASEGPWGRRARQSLLGIQLGGALLLLALAGVLSLQQRHLLLADRGFETHDRLVLGMETDPEKIPSLAVLTAALDRSPAIRHWAFSMERPAADVEGSRQMIEGIGGHRQMLRVSRVSPGFFDTYGMTVLAGHPQFSAAEDSVVIDAKAARLLGFPTPQDAVGALLRGGVCRDARCPSEGGFDQLGGGSQRVTAVIRDVTMESGHEVPRPQEFLLDDRPLWNLTVTGPDTVALRRALEAAWDAHGLKVPHDFQWADDQRAAVYRQEAQLTTIVATVSLLAVAVAMLGAYAMVADTLRRRRTELVLHRLHGASNAAIARQVAGEFAVPLLAAAAAALPLAGWIGWRYLANYHDHIGFSAGLGAPLLAAIVVTSLVVALASLRHVRRALALQPVEALS
ncbi:MAG: FtsX-like permease family protein [Burkholderiaceae bacterium]